MKTKTILWTVIAASLLALSALAQTNAVNVLAPVPAAPPPMDPSLSALLTVLGPKFAFLVPLFAKLFALSLVMKVVAPKIQSWASSWISQNVTTPGSDHDIAIRAILSNKVYRFVCVVLDMALSINLPTLSTYLKQLATANPGVTIEHPDGSVSAAPTVTEVVKTAELQPKASPSLAAPGAAGPGPMKLTLLGALLIPAVLLTGCGLFGGTTVAPTGPYGSGAVFGTNAAGQLVTTNAADGAILFQADQAIVNGQNLLEAFVLFAYQNQAALAPFPQIQIAANTVRQKAPQYVEAVVAARNAYQQNPTSATQSALTTALSVLSAAISSVQNYQAQASQYMAAHPPLSPPVVPQTAPLPPPAPVVVPSPVVAPTNTPPASTNTFQKVNP